MRGWILAMALVPLAGCSFIDDWGSLSTGPVEAMDGGDRDGGGDGTDGGAVDAGRDATVCNRCAAGCPSGERCVYEPTEDCEVCLPDPPEEGDPCDGPADCAADQRCFNGGCARTCTSGDDCAGATLGDLCIESRVGPICFGAMCDPVVGDPCDLTLEHCDFVGDSPDGNLGTACVADDGTRRSEGSACSGEFACEGGSVCVDVDSDGAFVCERVCWTDGDCGDGRACGPFATSSGELAMVDGRGVGVCFGGLGRQGDSCTTNQDCYAASSCWAGQCRMRCMTDSDCAVGTLCMDLDGDGNLECR